MWYCNVWQNKYTGDQFLGRPWSRDKSITKERTLLESHMFTKVGILRITLKEGFSYRPRNHELVLL
jgi:hypothetical protein